MVLSPVDVSKDTMTFIEWMAYGNVRGWCSDEVCSTHEGLPMSDEEDEAWEGGFDPCIFAVRIYGDGVDTSR